MSHQEFIAFNPKYRTGDYLRIPCEKDGAIDFEYFTESDGIPESKIKHGSIVVNRDGVIAGEDGRFYAVCKVVEYDGIAKRSSGNFNMIFLYILEYEDRTGDKVRLGFDAEEVDKITEKIPSQSYNKKVTATSPAPLCRKSEGVSAPKRILPTIIASKVVGSPIIGKINH